MVARIPGSTRTRAAIALSIVAVALAWLASTRAEAELAPVRPLAEVEGPPPAPPVHEAPLAPLAAPELRQAVALEALETPPPERRAVPTATRPRPRASDLVFGPLRGRVTVNGEAASGSLAWNAGSFHGRVDLRRGRYAIRRLPVGPVRLRPEPLLDGLDLRKRAADLERSVDFPGGALEHDLHLVVPLGPVSGRVRTGAGEPVAGTRVLARLGGEDVAKTFTDAEGNYELLLPAALDGFRVGAVGNLGWTSIEGVHAGTRGLDFTLPELARVELCAVDARTGRPVEGVFFEWRRQADPYLTSVSARASSGCVRTGVAAGLLEVLAWTEGGHAPALLRSVVAEPGDEFPRVELRLERGGALELVPAPDAPSPPPQCRIAVIEVGLADGLRAPRQPTGTTRSWYSHRRLQHTIAPLGEGRTVGGLAPGAYRLKAFPPVYRLEPAQVTVRRGTTSRVEVRWSRE